MLLLDELIKELTILLTSSEFLYLLFLLVRISNLLFRKYFPFLFSLIVIVSSSLNLLLFPSLKLFSILEELK